MSRSSPATPAAALTEFRWEVQPRAEALVQELVGRFLRLQLDGAEVARLLLEKAAVRFADIVDSIHVRDEPELRSRLEAVGFEREPDGEAPGPVYAHALGMFPRIVMHGDGVMRVWLKVESVADFLVCWRRPEAFVIRGEPMCPLRIAPAWRSAEAELWVVERHGWRGFEPSPPDHHRTLAMLHHHEQFRRRRREFEHEEQGFDHALRLIDAAIADLRVDLACDLFFAAEREYWQSRNRAARAQKARQDSVGIGWANHDHHTYRSSRRHFARLMGVFDRLGFRRRERFYAGREAGWGAQIVEQPATGVVIFADVDLAPEEVLIDFAHEPLPERRELGTVGLWCALHGESFLQAGLHHLECQFDFDLLQRQLAADWGVNTMKPFSNYPHLRQAFTEGERWAVDPARVQRLLESGRITVEQAAKFNAEGAIGSHLENLERNAGFKGFNQKGINEIITATDPRRQGGVGN